MSGAPRESWHDYFLGIAAKVSSRATCERRHVGALIVRDKSILATGYNGSIRGLPHCDDEGHLMEDGHCVRTIHAEANALIQAARNGVRVEGATAYVTDFPCRGCFSLLAQAGVTQIVYRREYRMNEGVLAMIAATGVLVEHVPATAPPLASIVRMLMAVAEERIRHRFQGECPTASRAPSARDPDCDACNVLVAAHAALAAEGEEP